MNKVKRIILGLLLMSLTVILTVILVPKTSVYAGSYDESTKQVTLSVAASNEEYGYATPAENTSTICIVISGTTQMTGVATVYYTTADRSACANAGDYNDVTDSVTISKTNTSVRINLTVNTTTKFATLNSDGTLSLRYFMFEIIDIDYDNQEAGETCVADNYELKCGLRAEHTMTAAENSTTDSSYRFQYYEQYAKWRRSSQWMSVNDNDREWTDYFFENSQNNIWINDYVNSGLANVYAGMEMQDLYDKGPSAADLWFNLHTKTGTQLQRYKFDYTEFSNDDLWYTDVWHSGTDTIWSTKKYSTDDWQKSDGESDLYVMDKVTPQLIFTSGGGVTRLMKTTDSSKSTNTVNDVVIRVEMDNDDGGWSIYRRKGYVIATETLQDFTKPEAINTYIDASKMYLDGKFRVAVRFTEPVQLYQKDQTTCLWVSINRKSYYLPYEGGAGTDTLYFSIDASSIAVNTDLEKVSVGRICDASGSEINNVCDFALHYSSTNDHSGYAPDPYQNYANFATWNYTGGYDDGESVDVSVKLNLGKKTVSIDAGDNVASATRLMNISIDTAHGGFYYSWVREEELTSFLQKVSEAKTSDNPFSPYSEYVRICNTASDATSTSFTVEGLDENNKTLNGKYIFCYACDGGNGKTTYSDNDVIYTFDSKAPTISAEELTSDLLIYKTFAITAKDIYTYNNTDYDGCGISTIALNYSFVKGQTSGAKTGTIVIWNGANTEAVTDDEGWLTLGAKSYDATTGALSFTIAPAEIGLDYENGDYGTFEFELLLTDTCGNVTTETFPETSDYDVKNTFRFDTRTLFDVTRVVTSEVGDAADQLVVSTTDFQSYLLNNGDATNVIRLSFSPETSGDKFVVKSLIYSGVQYVKNGALISEHSTDYSTYFSYDKLIATDAAKTITITPKAAGSMQIIFTLDSTKTSDTFSYYFTENETDATVNHEAIFNAHYVKTKVYQLGFTEYRYMTDAYSMQKVNYNGSSSNLYFSSSDEAQKYLRYYEYQDLYLLHLDNQTMVDNLKSNSLTEYRIADNESVEPKLGQYWIRYKKSTYSPSNTSTTQWGYYYYTDSSTGIDTINISMLSDNLKNAITKVVATLMANGCADTYLSDSTNLKSNGMIYIADSQMITETLKCSQTLSGSAFGSEISYAADTNIYSDSYIEYKYENNTAVIKSTNTSTHLLMHNTLTEGSNTKLFRVETSADGTESYIEITGFDGLELDSFMDEGYSGVVEFIEFDDNGINRFKLLVDHDAPELTIEYSSSEDGTTTTVTLNESNDGQTYGIKSLDIIGIGGFTSSSGSTVSTVTEADYYSYVAIYKVTRLTTTLDQTLTLAELKTKSFTFDDASYLVKVADRYGNSYSFTINLMQTALSCKSKIADDNESLTVEIVNRDEDEIYSYKITTPSGVITEYASKRTFYESGYYFIEITDIYGYVYRGEDLDPSGTGIYYRRNNPELTWKYLASDGTYCSYTLDKTTGEPVDGQPMKIIQQSENLFYLVTSTDLQFTYSGDYKFEWIGTEPEYDYEAASHRYTIHSTIGWSLKVSYTEYPDVYATYTCELDATAPTVNAYYDLSQYKISDEKYLENLIAAMDLSSSDLVIQDNIVYQKTRDENGQYVLDTSGNFVLEPLTLEGNTAYYTEDTSDTDRIYLKSGDQCQSQNIVIYVSDNNGVKTCTIYLDDQALDSSAVTFNAKDNTYSAQLTEYGKYTIVAEDYFGNKTSFTFTSKSDNVDARYVDSKEVTDTKTYGNTSDEIVIASSGIIRYYITGESSSHQYVFSIGETGVTRVAYGIMRTTDEDGNIQYKITTVQVAYAFELDNEDYEDGIWYEVLNITDSISVMHDDDGYHFKTNSNLERKDIQVGYSSENVIPFEYETILSQEKTNIILENASDEEIETNETGEVILIHDEFHIGDETSLKDITKIRISFSKTTSFINYTTIYSGTELYTIDSTRDGFYLIEITNVFGNVLTYTLSKSNSMMVVVTVEYADGTQMYYDNEYTSTTYSNSSVTLTIYATSGNFSVTRELNGKSEMYTGYEVVTDTSSKSITISSEGNFSAYLYDEYGNTKVRKFQISKSGTITYDDGLIYGYNEKALRMDEGYTNTKLSVDYLLLISLDIAYVSVEHDGTSEILYDIISAKNVVASEELLLNSIGTQGDGTYTVTFRDKFGNAVSKTIHYQETPTLQVNYKYRSSTKYLSATVGEDVWCNNAVELVTTAKTYEFKLDSAKTAIPDSPFTFSSSDGNGQFDYHIEYVDEYGFSYDFYIHLLRQTITIELASGIAYTEIDGVLVTREDFSIVSTNDTTVTYKMDTTYGPYDYEENEILIEESVYEFTAVDRAGNQATLTVQKDRSVDKTFTETSTGRTLFSGYVASGKVTFDIENSDSSQIYKAYRNGTEIDIADEYSTTGKYEFLLRDAVGNEGYFMFYIITHALSTFEYSVPFNYVITELWRVDSAGYTNTYLDNENVKVDEYFNITEDGKYTVTMVNNYTTDTITFKFTIDSTPSSAKLSGCSEGETTVNTVTITGCEEGDTVYIYKDGKLYKTVEIESSADEPSISEGGTYKVVVVNEAGVETVMNFVKTPILNTAGSILVIAVLVAVSMALFAGLAVRKRSKIDK